MCLYSTVMLPTHGGACKLDPIGLQSCMHGEMVESKVATENQERVGDPVMRLCWAGQVEAEMTSQNECRATGTELALCPASSEGCDSLPAAVSEQSA